MTRRMCRRAAVVNVMVIVLTVAAVSAQTSPAPAPPREVIDALRAIYRLRDYTAFDWISAAYQRGTLTLDGLAHTPKLRERAEEVARRTDGVEEVVNNIDLLPTHAGDDQLRIRLYASIYGHPALESYAPGGQLSPAAIDELVQAGRFGLEGADVGRGPHPIHILVSGGRVILRGQVRTAGDRQIAEAQARTTPGVLAVTNELRVPGQKRR